MAGTGLRFVLNLERGIETCELGKVPTLRGVGNQISL
jgi:hypothetical protein